MEPRLSQLLRDLLHHVTLDIVADLKLGEALDADAAFHAGTNLVDFVLKAAEGLSDAFIDNLFAAPHPHFAFHNATAA